MALSSNKTVNLTQGAPYEALGDERSYLQESFGNVHGARIVGSLGALRIGNAPITLY